MTTKHTSTRKRAKKAKGPANRPVEATEAAHDNANTPTTGESPQIVTSVDSEGKWIQLVREPDGSERPPTEAELAESKRRFQASMQEMRRELAEGLNRVVYDPDYCPPFDSRYLEYARWASGRLPNYGPTIADLAMLAAERARQVYGAGKPGLTELAVRSKKAKPGTKKPKRRRKRVPRSFPSERERDAWSAYERLKTYTAVGKELGISRQAATDLVKRADEIINPKGRSVRPQQSIPTDRRGQETITDGE